MGGVRNPQTDSHTTCPRFEYDSRRPFTTRPTNLAECILSSPMIARFLFHRFKKSRSLTEKRFNKFEVSCIEIDLYKKFF